MRELFGVIHRRELLTAERFQTQLEAARGKVLRCGTQHVPATNHCRNLAKRFEEHGESYFRFITTPGVEPTNNLAEQAIRFVVIDRLITQGTRSEKGNRWCERIWTVIATCTQQGRSVFWRRRLGRGSRAPSHHYCCRGVRASEGPAVCSDARLARDREVLKRVQQYVMMLK